MRLIDRVLRRSVPELVRIACVLALLALALICWSVLQPRPVPVILAMSAGHALGGTAFVCYLLAVVLDAVQRPPPSGEAPVLSAVARALVDAKKHTGSVDSSPTTEKP